ncbi:hypothetical protein GOB57_07940 [Sinorhizobium meliloti]|nr:hypothetical protein [Sinorhizobium meliloti]
MKIEDYNTADLVPPHGKQFPLPKPEWEDLQSLVWCDQPLMIAMGSATEPYVGFAGADQHALRTTYFVIPFTVPGIEAFMAGNLTVEGAVKLAGGDLYYTDDLEVFRRVQLQDMPEDDRIVLSHTGSDYHEIMEKQPAFVSL